MEPVTYWDLIHSDFNEVSDFMAKIITIKFGDNIIIKQSGYTFDEPGIVFEISGVDSISDDDITYLKENLLKFGANRVHIGYDMETGVISCDVYILKNHAKAQNSTQKKSLCCKTINTLSLLKYRFLILSGYIFYRYFL
tara:strand:+ start:54181 stop:54597 length:417 start_codon:yes stop_codon:yes gene_type:complete